MPESLPVQEQPAAGVNVCRSAPTPGICDKHGVDRGECADAHLPTPVQEKDNPEPAYRHDVDYLADQLRQYIDRTAEEMANHLRASVNGYPGLMERQAGYEAAMEDLQTMLRDETHQFHRGLRRYITAAREVSRRG